MCRAPLKISLLSGLPVEILQLQLQLQILTVFFYKLRNPHGTPTFKTEELRLVSNVQLVKRVMNSKYSITHTTRFVTKAPPINSIDSKCRTEKLKGSRTCLIGYSDFISRE